MCFIQSMNRKNLIVTLVFALLMIGLAGVRLTTHAAASDNSLADKPAELVLTFEVRIRLPLSERDIL